MEGNENTFVVGDPLVRDLFGRDGFESFFFLSPFRNWNHSDDSWSASVGLHASVVLDVPCYPMVFLIPHLGRQIVIIKRISKWILKIRTLYFNTITISWLIYWHVHTYHSLYHKSMSHCHDFFNTHFGRTLSQRNLGGNSLSIKKVVHMNS